MKVLGEQHPQGTSNDEETPMGDVEHSRGGQTDGQGKGHQGIEATQSDTTYQQLNGGLEAYGAFSESRCQRAK
jgi:hypothetical protein